MSEQVNPNRALRELTDWVRVANGRLSILFSETEAVIVKINGVEVPICGAVQYRRQLNVIKG